MFLNNQFFQCHVHLKMHTYCIRGSVLNVIMFLLSKLIACAEKPDILEPVLRQWSRCSEDSVKKWLLDMWTGTRKLDWHLGLTGERGVCLVSKNVCWCGVAWRCKSINTCVQLGNSWGNLEEQQFLWFEWVLGDTHDCSEPLRKFQSHGSSFHRVNGAHSCFYANKDLWDL